MKEIEVETTFFQDLIVALFICIGIGGIATTWAPSFHLFLEEHMSTGSMLAMCIGVVVLVIGGPYYTKETIAFVRSEMFGEDKVTNEEPYPWYYYSSYWSKLGIAATTVLMATFLFMLFLLAMNAVGFLFYYGISGLKEVDMFNMCQECVMIGCSLLMACQMCIVVVATFISYQME